MALPTAGCREEVIASVFGPRRTAAPTLALAGLLVATSCSSERGADEIAGTASVTATSPAAANGTTAPPSSPVATAALTTAVAITASSTAAPATSSAPPASGADVDPVALVETLASDALQGRDNSTAESASARETLIAELSRFALPWDPSAADADGYLQAFANGDNVIGIVPGTELADEYVMVGAHYDHLAPGDCRLVTADDRICNGAVDNATGVAATMAIGAALASDPPRRSVIIAFWDAEEDGLVGSRAFVASPVVPLDRIVTYVNFDMQGSRLLPSLATRTFAVGAETGGAGLTNLLTEITDASSLDYSMLSLIMGQGRSDHAPLAAAKVPIVFLTDSTNGCYHSVDDEMAMVDVDKLGAQIAMATELVRRLANDDLGIEFDAAAPTTSFTDAERLLDLARAGENDLAGVDQGSAETARRITDTLDAVVAAGPDAYSAAAEGAVLGAAAQLVDLLTNLDCALAQPD